MNFINYIKDALKPGGTPKRYLVWVSIVLLAQTYASVYPLSFDSELFPNFSHFVVIIITTLVVGLNFLKTDQQRINAAYFLYIIGLMVCTLTISLGIASLSGIIFMLTWAMTLFVAERREYISFNLVTVFMVLMLITTVVLLLFNPTFEIENNYLILMIGAIITSINIYLVYIDFDTEKNFYKEYREVYSNMEKLSFKMSEILSSEGELEVLLSHVAQKCIPYLGLEDCVIYLYNEEKEHLVQVAAYGEKNTEDNQILNPIILKPSQGIVGKCFSTGEPVLIEETSKYEGYIVDDIYRNSELAVPIISNGNVVGVIDSEHSLKGFFKERHVQSFKIIASFCGIKITEQKSRVSIELARVAQEEIDRYKELDEMKQRFIANISHDLKTPLSLIKGPAIQINQLSKDTKINTLSNFIVKNTDHLLRVVNQLLQLNRVDEGLNQLYLEEIETIQLMNKIKEQYEELALEKQIMFHSHFDAFVVVSDAFRVEQIIHNLLHNAFRYTPSGGRIELKASHQKEFFEIEISDNGPGIALEIQDKIFDRFFKVNVNNHEGTGIGLSLVKEYVHSLGGKISIESELDKGTVFRIKLPLNLKRSETTNEENSVGEELLVSEEENVKPIMLVVEDHADLNNFICSYFEPDFQCFSAFDGEEALREIRKHIPDIIISDLMMPKLDGNKLIDQVKSNEQFAHIPIIILSAKDQLNSKVELYEKGVENYLTKPFDILELKAVVDSVLSQRRKLFETFFENINKTPPTFEDEKKEKFSILVKDVLAFILENLENSELNVALICEALSIGRNRLQKEIKTETGLTPVEFIRSLRLNEAKNKLSDYRQTVSEVAYSVGFNNLSYFSRSFKTEFGMLPTEWQESNQLKD